MLTKDEIDELERLHKEATPGEWFRVVRSDAGQFDLCAGEEVCTGDGAVLSGDCDGFLHCPKDLELIVTVRNLLPRIIAALREKS